MWFKDPQMVPVCSKGKELLQNTVVYPFVFSGPGILNSMAL